MQLFLLALIVAHVATAAAVDGCRSDRDKDHRPRENCTAAGLKDIPAGLELTTRVLLFPSNQFSSLSWTSFQIFPQIYEIDLTANEVPEVTPTAAPVLPTLSVLRLGANRLTSLSDGSFSASPALTELYLDGNAITSLSDNTFSGLSKLEILDLSANHIVVLPDLMLHPLPAIETLYVENNKIRVMPDNWFSQKEEVPYLYLSANPWACFCSLSYLRTYLEDNELNVYVRDGKVIKSDVESVVCDSPRAHKGTPVVIVEESDLCSPSTESGPLGDVYQPIHTTDDTTVVPTIFFEFSTEPPFPPAPPARQTTPAFLDSGYSEVVTWSWYELFTNHSEWLEVITEKSSVGFHDLATQTILPPVIGSTDGPTKRTETTVLVPLTATATTPSTPKLQVVPTDPTPTSSVSSSMFSTPPWRENDSVGVHWGHQGSSAGAAGVFCVWLFAGCLLLCVASALCILVTLMKLVFWYRKVYRPLIMMVARRSAGRGVMLPMHGRGGEEGVMALYRSVLFVHTEGADATGEQKEGEGREESQVITLKPSGGDDEGRGGRGVYRKTLYRLLSKEEEIEGWRNVTEEVRVSTEDGGIRRAGGGEEQSGGGGGRSKKRYSVILREEREEGGGGRREELDWVVGGWEVKRGGEAGEEPRSSWGEWLAHYLPSMPWGVTTPPEDEAAL